MSVVWHDDLLVLGDAGRMGCCRPSESCWPTFILPSVDYRFLLGMGERKGDILSKSMVCDGFRRANVGRVGGGDCRLVVEAHGIKERGSWDSDRIGHFL